MTSFTRILRRTVFRTLVAFAVSLPGLLTPNNATSLQVWDRDLGSFGSTPGSFIKPVGVAVDTEGNVFVVDVETATLQKFELKAHPATWPKANAEFDRILMWSLEDARPTFVAVDDEDRIYLTDMSCDCVYKLAGGAFTAAWGSEGTGDGQFRDPSGLATDKEDIFVVDSKNHRVQKFSSDGELVAKWGSFGKKNGEFAFPIGIAVDDEGAVYVADTGNHRIQKFSGDGSFLAAWGRKGTGEGEFNRPTDVALDREGHVYVVDSENHRVQVFGDDGEYISEWGKRGDSIAEFKTPLSIAVSEEDYGIYVSDSGNSRVQRFMVASGKTKWGVLRRSFGKKP